jgi:hypothetical protein
LPAHRALFTKALTCNRPPLAPDHWPFFQFNGTATQYKGRTPVIGTTVTLNRMAVAAVKKLGEFGCFRQLNSSDPWERVRR